VADPSAAPEALEVLGRAGRGRLAPAAGGLRAVQQAVLRSFAATGRPPASGVLEAAAVFGAAACDVLAELAREDFLVLDGVGQIRAAYPFSTAPTRHRVRIGGQAEVYAMCAIDALGIPPMLAADAVISSAEPATGAPITVTFTSGHAVWQPSGAVVLTARRGDGPAAEVACGYINFFTRPATARAWAQAHSDLTGRMLSQAQAERLGRNIFGSLLA
jgi:hypothetical protein